MKLNEILLEKGLATFRKLQPRSTHQSNNPGKEVRNSNGNPQRQPKNTTGTPGKPRVEKSNKGVGRPKGSTTEDGVKIKPRPKKDLWFKDRKSWASDLQWELGGEDNVKIIDTEQQEVVVTNRDGDLCYGVWRDKEQRGVTYKKARPLYNVIHPKRRHWFRYPEK